MEYTRRLHAAPVECLVLRLVWTVIMQQSIDVDILKPLIKRWMNDADAALKEGEKQKTKDPTISSNLYMRWFTLFECLKEVMGLIAPEAMPQSLASIHPIHGPSFPVVSQQELEESIVSPATSELYALGDVHQVQITT